jgi:hypothetical protein
MLQCNRRSRTLHAHAGATGYRAWWRETTAPQWQHSLEVGDTGLAVLKGIDIDVDFFGVSAIGRDGRESPVEFPGFAGSFARPPLDANGNPVNTMCPGLAGFSGRAVGPPSWRKAAGGGG